MKILIIGCGISGSTIARLSAEDGHSVDLIDKRNHIGGNVYDYIDGSTGIRLSKYGVHIFHTSNQSVWDFVNKYSEWTPYQHKVLSRVDNKFVPIPVNITTLNELLNQNINTEEEAIKFFDSIQYKGDINNSEDAARSRVGDILYQKMFENYTIKQWDKHPRELDKSVLQRIPYRTNYNDRYFNDTYEAIPKYGYTAFVQNLLNHQNIRIRLNTEYQVDINKEYDLIFFTGKIDSYFDNKYGRLEYRSLIFEYETLNIKEYQKRTQVNYPERHFPFTRIIEYKHLYPIDIDKTIIVKEYSTSTGDEYYPMPTKSNQDIYLKYQKEAEEIESKNNVYFAGRLANYKYMNMDEAIFNAIKTYEKSKINNKISPIKHR